MIKKALIILTAFTLGCSNEITDLDNLCKDLSNSYECAQKIEKYQIKHYKNLVSRNGKKLILNIDNNKKIILEDIDKESDGIWYSFREYYSIINYYLVNVQYYEGLSFLLVDKANGNMIRVPGKIKISPDNQRFVSWNMDLEAAYSLNGFTIFNKVNNVFEKEYELYPDDWGPSDAKWINNTKIEFEKTSWVNSNLTSTGRIEYEYNEKWYEKK